LVFVIKLNIALNKAISCTSDKKTSNL